MIVLFDLFVICLLVLNIKNLIKQPYPIVTSLMQPYIL